MGRWCLYICLHARSNVSSPKQLGGFILNLEPVLEGYNISCRVNLSLVRIGRI
jgi:hypothetical protein